MKSSVLVLAILMLTPAATLASPAPQASQQSASPRSRVFDGSHIGIEGLAGLGTPLGVVGAALFYSPSPLVSLEVGSGVGLDMNWQRAAMVRVQPRLDVVGMSIGLGVSSGAFTWRHGGWNLPAHKHWDDARWANLELGITATARRMQFRGFVGYSGQLTPHVGCTDRYVRDDSGFPTDEPPRPCTGDAGTSLIYIGTALRFAAPLGI